MSKYQHNRYKCVIVLTKNKIYKRVFCQDLESGCTIIQVYSTFWALFAEPQCHTITYHTEQNTCFLPEHLVVMAFFPLCIIIISIPNAGTPYPIREVSRKFIYVLGTTIVVMQTPSPYDSQRITHNLSRANHV